MPTPTTAWMQEVERRRMPKPSVQGRIYSVSRVKGILCFYYLKLSLIKILSLVNNLQFKKK